jgi:Protein of unknown function (DUF3800)
MSAWGQSWKQEVSVPCVPPITALTRRMHPLRFAGRLGKADRLLECRLCESQNFFLFDSDRGVNCVWKRLVLRNSFFPASAWSRCGGMKFVYVDESGDQGQSDIFVMAGLLIDAYRLRKWTAAFDEMIKAFLKMHPKAPQELKTKAFINGANKWSEVDADDRKQFLEDVCDLAAECARIFAVAFSFDDFKKAVVAGYNQPFGKSYWLGAAMFVSALVQKRMQDEKRNKGLTVLICDDNKQEMANLSEGLYQADAWFDPIYQTSKKKKGKAVWNEVPDNGRFDHIVNSAFAIKSVHSSLIQVADAVSYVYRRHLELKREKEAWAGERLISRSSSPGLKRSVKGLGAIPAGHASNFTKPRVTWVL